ncbi:hypothetical protein IFM89_020110 [Coptis chinensis]|uniref:Poly [ADP-ribose] polymerase n=1 Tax=Coptis chinensis TaxID=261450 RepID=A0A835IU62_9MAGN|nr:hypothetical protein IFM89_020110 [Coptis chinensis]
MEVENAKVLDNGRRIVVDLKRKRAARSMAHFTGAACADAQCAAEDALPQMFCKQMGPLMDFDGCKNSFLPCVKKSLVKNYSNFRKTGLPERVLFYENGDWTDFPEGFIDLVKEDFKMQKVAMEVEFRGCPSLLDFLHMILVDLKTGVQKPIAWIDEAGICFFPEIHSGNNEFHDCFQSGGKENHPLLYSDPNESHEIKLQLEIEVTTGDNFKMEDCSEGSNNIVKRLKVEEAPGKVCFGLDQEESTDEKSVREIKEVIGENRMLKYLPREKPHSGFLNEKLTTDAVQHMLITGMGSSICADNIHGIQRSTGYWAQSRLELFEKQVEITEKYRGNANVQYAWLGSSKEAVSRILMHGLGFNELPKTKTSYGSGVHLTSVSCSHVSASYCDVDENGVQHMVLCRVILGNMELVHPGSEQFCPSGENFDSGVDDLLNPEHYTIWNMNMNTHIYPEYVVSFKRASKGLGSGSESKDGVSAVTISNTSQEKLQTNMSPTDSVGYVS